MSGGIAVVVSAQLATVASAQVIGDPTGNVQVATGSADAGAQTVAVAQNGCATSGWVAVSVGGCAGTFAGVAVSGTGAAQNSTGGWAASGTGPATGSTAVSGTNNADGDGDLALSGRGSACGGTVTVGYGDACSGGIAAASAQGSADACALAVSPEGNATASGCPLGEPSFAFSERGDATANFVAITATGTATTTCGQQASVAFSTGPANTCSPAPIAVCTFFRCFVGCTVGRGLPIPTCTVLCSVDCVFPLCLPLVPSSVPLLGCTLPATSEQRARVLRSS